jgi:hypothetical protein
MVMKNPKDSRNEIYINDLTEETSSYPHSIIKILQGEPRWKYIRARGWESHYRKHPEKLR